MEFLQIIVDNIFPLLTFMLIGYILDVKYRVNVAALSKLTVFVVLPCFIFYSIYVAELDMDMFFVFLLSCMQMALIGILAWAVGKARGFSPEKIEAFKNGTMFSNNGNIGIALIALVFTHAPYIVDGKAPYLAEAGAAAAMTLVQMNMTLHTVGLYQAGKGVLKPREALAAVFRLPVPYVLCAVFLIKWSGFNMTSTFLWPVMQNSSGALAAIVMTTLGMQIHKSRISFGDMDGWLGCFVRLIGGPAAAYGLILFLRLLGVDFDPVICQTIMIMGSVPSAANSVLYAVEFHNMEDFATELVMMSTVLSCMTMPGVIYISRMLFPV